MCNSKGLALNRISSEVFRGTILSASLLVGALTIGIPAGLFEDELSSILGVRLQQGLHQALQVLMSSAICFLFSKKWPSMACTRAFLSIIVVQVLSLVGAEVVGSPQVPTDVIAVELAVTLIFSVAASIIARHMCAEKPSLIRDHPADLAWQLLWMRSCSWVRPAVVGVATGS